MKTRFAILCAGIVLFALLGISQAQAPTVVGYASAKCRMSSVAVYSTANLFSTGSINGFTNVFVAGDWTFGGGSRGIAWGSPSVVSSAGTFASAQGSYSATCEVSMSQSAQAVGYVIKDAATKKILRTSDGMQKITSGAILVKSPLNKATPKKK